MDKTPGGAQTRSKQAGVFGVGERWVDAADGSRVYLDDNQREYTDWIAALAAVGLGYGHNQNWLDNVIGVYTAYPLPTRRESEVAAQLIEAVGFGEQVRWVTTGSEGTLAAMMIARRATGRRRIVSVGYHGWHEAHLPSDDLLALPIGCRAGAAKAITAHTAAVIIEACRNEGTEMDGPISAHLQEIVDAARYWGALVIYDEIVTGFRWAVGGAREYFGLPDPDLSVFGKAMSNGYPIAAVVGNRAVMKHANDISSTYGGWPPALEAVSETINVYRERHVVDHMWDLGEDLLTRCPNILAGYPVHPVFVTSADYTTSVGAQEWVKKAAAGGHLVHPAGFNVMLAHTPEDVASLANALHAPPSPVQG